MFRISLYKYRSNSQTHSNFEKEDGGRFAWLISQEIEMILQNGKKDLSGQFNHG